MTKASKNFEKNRTIILEEVGNFCRNIRINKLKLSQRKIAHIFEVEQATISKFERGLLDSVSLYMMYLSLLSGEQLWQN